MNLQSVQTVRRLVCKRATVLAALLASSACAPLEEDDPGFDPADRDYITQSELLTRCAAQGAFCSFTGTRKVRFGRSTTVVTRSFMNGVWCTNESFGVDYGTGNSCTLDTSEQVSGALPKGSPGVATVQLRATSEQPGASDGTGAFRTKCLYSHMNYDDAIVYPGKPGAAHLHTYFGNTRSNASSTASSLRTGGNSTCRGGVANRSSYWVPAVLDQSGAPVVPVDADIYYKTGYNGLAPSAIKPFPAGLRMIAGDMRSAKSQTRAYWGCHEHYIGHPGAIPDCPQGDKVVMYVVFPQCWDGKNLDSVDHVSHVAYASGGRCPTSHPVAIPEITFNVYYAVPPSGTAGWRLSSDMYAKSLPGGYSAHGDYFEAWDPAVVQTFVARCLNPALDCHSHLLGDGRMMYNSLE